LLLLGAVGCGTTKPSGSPFAVARAWAASQRAGEFAQACRLTSTSNVATMGGLHACSRFYARRVLGGDPRVFAARPRNRYPLNTFAVFGGDGVTAYFVQVIVDDGHYRVEMPRAILTGLLGHGS
jgi:hypothetical protein